VPNGGLANSALKLYPAWWRDRYLEEAQTVTHDLIEAGRSRWRIALNLSGGALRARLTATGMPPDVEPWVSRTRASIVLATAPTLAVVPLMLTIRQVPALPNGSAWTSPNSHLASMFYLLLVLAFWALVLTLIWGYTSLSSGVLARGENGRGLRLLTRVPGYLVCLGVGLFMASGVIEPHTFINHGKDSIPLNGHPLVAHVLSISAIGAFSLCWAASVVLLRAVAHRAEIPVASLRSGKRVSAAVSTLLWFMSAAALAMSVVYSKHMSELSGFKVQSVVLGHSLLLLGILLCVLSVASTLGTVLSSRSWKVASHLAR
jgi:hypothetical protein